MWGNATTIWAVNEVTDKLEAYQKSTGNDDNDKDISLHSDNAAPAGIWSDGTTMWVADHNDGNLYAYTLSGGSRESSKDIGTSASGNVNPRGVWSDGGTIWVTSEDDDKVYAYNLVSRLSDDTTLSALTVSPKDIIGFAAGRTSYEVGVASTVTTATVAATANNAFATVGYSGTDASSAAGHQVDLNAGQNAVTVTVTAEDTTTQEYTVNINRGVTDSYGWKAADDLDGLIAASNGSPYGIWANSTTMWVADSFDKKIYAYNLSTKAHDASKDFNTLSAAGNDNPSGIWSDGQTMWVSDIGDKKLYAYRMSDKGTRLK